jgi:quinol monooxygenase YgiN
MRTPTHIFLSLFFVFALSLSARAEVALINRFEVPTAQADAFFEAWNAAKELLTQEYGCMGGAFYQSIENPTIWINIAIWPSTEEYAAGIEDPQFKAFIEKISALGVTGSPDLYETVDQYDGKPGS